jgi:hypothetical protein
MRRPRSVAIRFPLFIRKGCAGGYPAAAQRPFRSKGEREGDLADCKISSCRKSPPLPILPLCKGGYYSTASTQPCV